MSFTIFPGHSTLVKSEWEQWTTNRPGTTGEVNGTFLSTPPATTDKLNNNEKAALSVYKMDNTQPSITERIFKLTLAQHDLPPESCLEQSTTTQQQDKGARKLKSSLRLATLQDSRKSSGKAVKFDRLHLEKICLFEETQSPNQVPSSHKVNLPLFKVEYTQWPLVQHILFQQHRQNVQLKRSLKLLQDGTLLHGQVVVRNLGYEKVVEIRYTLDGWQTVKNTQATYLHGRGSLDMFAFDLDIQEGMADRGHRRATIDMAVRYTVTVTDNNYYHRHKEQQYYRHNEEMTFWDNNDGHNYQIQIVASAAKQVVQLNQVTSIDKEKKEACDNDNLVLSSSPSTTTGFYYNFDRSLVEAKLNVKPPIPFMPPSPPLSPPYSSAVLTSLPLVSTTFNPGHYDSINLDTPSSHTGIILAENNLRSDEGDKNQAINLSSYSDLVNKYCFYESH